VSAAGLVGFLAELSRTSGAALYRFSLLEQAAREWLDLRTRLSRNGRLVSGHHEEQLQERTRIFEALEAFLAAWSRVSLILFPVSHRSSARKRAKALRTALGITQTSPLTERHLRDGWMRYDERLDEAGTPAEAGPRQRFVHSSEVTERGKLLCVRIVEVNTLVVWCRDRWGRPVPIDLRRLAKGIRGLVPLIEPAAARLKAP
jgi:hypothetical protein